MVKDAEQFAEQDKKRREEAEIRNNADSLMYTSEKTKKDLAEKLTKDQVEKIDRASDELRKALAGTDVELIKTKSEALAKVLQEIGTAVYQQVAQERARSEQPPTGSPPQGEPENKVVDAEYEVKDEKK
jgi:molecular chaperone DnaK